MVVNPKLVSYITEQMNKGLSKEQVYDELIKEGWRKIDID